MLYICVLKHTFNTMKLSEIKANPNNPRKIEPEKLDKLVESIKSFPEMLDKRPMVCVTDADGKLYPLGGNQRLKALQKIGYKEIPDTWVMLADEWTIEQRNEFLIKDNVAVGEWDWEDLKQNWDCDLLSEWGLDIPDFEIEPEKEEKDLSDNIEVGYKIEIECSSEFEQEKLYNELIERGIECRLLTL